MNPATRYLVVRGANTALRIALPALGRLTLGSNPEADLRLHEPGIAPEHLQLFLDHGLAVRQSGAPTTIVAPDGTERAAPPHEVVDVTASDRIRLGSVELVFAEGIATSAPHRLWTQAYFEDQLQTVLWDGGDTPALVVAVLKFAQGLDDEALLSSLFDRLGRQDIVAALGNDRVAVLVHGVRGAEAEHLSRSLARTLDRQGYAVQVGMALPSDSADPGKLLEIATQRLRLLEVGDHKPTILKSEDPATRKVIALIEQVATSTAHVLVQGETGTGKELVVEALHAASPQAHRRMVRVRASELSAAALEARDSPWSRAGGGLLFIDEIAALPADAQGLLGQRLDDERADPDRRVRVVATTNQDLKVLAGQNRFRTDLYYRLNQVSIGVPPLRQRHADILSIARQCIRDASEALGRPPPKLTKSAEALLLAYGWPGNIRELRNAMERALLICTQDTIGTEFLTPDITGPSLAVPNDPTSPREKPLTLRAEMAALERRRILEALEKYPTQTDAAKALDIPLRTFLNRLDALGIPRARKPAKGK